MKVSTEYKRGKLLLLLAGALLATGAGLLLVNPITALAAVLLATEVHALYYKRRADYFQEQLEMVIGRDIEKALRAELPRLLGVENEIEKVVKEITS